MGRIKEIFHGEHRRFAWFVVITLSFFLFVWIVGPGTTVVHWIRAKVEISRQEKIIENYRRENAALDERYQMLKHDRDSLEKFAREQFHFAAPGDDVYLLEED